MNYFLKLLSALMQCIGGKSVFTKIPLQDFLSNLNAVISTNESTEFITGHGGGLGGGIALFCCQKKVEGLGPFGAALKNRHTIFFKSDTMRKAPQKN